MAMMVTIHALFDLMSGDGLGAEDIALAVGPIVHDPGPPLAAQLAPSLPGVEGARFTRDRDSGAPDGLSLDLAPAMQPSLAEFVAEFGAYREARADFEQPRTLVFRPPPRMSRSVALIAEIVPGIDSVARVTFRRDDARAFDDHISRQKP